MNPLLLILGGGILLYAAYEKFAGSLPADAFPLLGDRGAAVQLASGQSGVVSGQTLTGPGYVYYSPSEAKFLVSSTTPTAAQLAAAHAALGQSAAGTGTPASASGTGTGTTTTTTGGNTMSTQPAGAQGEPAHYSGPGGSTYTTPITLSALWSAIQQWAAVDPSFTGSGANLAASPYHWVTTLNAIWPQAPTNFLGGWPLPLEVIFPGVDLSQSMTASQFWAGMLPYLQQGGLSGLGASREDYAQRWMA